MLLASRNQDFMPTLFNELLNWNNWNNCSYEEQKAMPKMNVSETDTNYELELSVPGLSKEDLSLSVDSDNNLVIEMVQHEEKKEEKKDRHYLRHEFSTMQFKQLFSLPENVKKEAISAKVEHGILYVTLPKVTDEEKKALSQKITIC
jgi:HSP20 family protein